MITLNETEILIVLLLIMAFGFWLGYMTGVDDQIRRQKKNLEAIKAELFAEHPPTPPLA